MSSTPKTPPVVPSSDNSNDASGKSARTGHNGPVQHTASEFATSNATQGATLSKSKPAPARNAEGEAREAPKGPPQHTV